MGKRILYGMDISPPVRAVLLTAKAVGLELEYKHVDLFARENRTKEFLNMNPQHTVPLLDDEGTIIWDSHAIVTYIVSKYAKDDSLYPKDLYKRARIDQRLHFDSAILYPRLRAITVGVYVFNNKEIAQEKIDAVFEAYDFMEKFLEKDLYMVGNTVTVADFCCSAIMSSFVGIVPFDSNKYPKITEWMKRCAELPYYEEANGRAARNHISFYNKKLEELRKAS